MIQLTSPLGADELRLAFPRALRAVDDTELEVWLEIEEQALRAQFGVTERSADSDTALRRAMLAAWPSFHAQVRQIAQESTSTDGHSVTYARARADQDFAFPAFVATILADYVDADASTSAPSTTELVR